MKKLKIKMKNFLLEIVVSKKIEKYLNQEQKKLKILKKNQI